MREKMSLLVVALLALTGAATDPSPAKPYRSRIAGLEFIPPPGGIVKRSVNGIDLVEFVYPDLAWNVRATQIGLHTPIEGGLFKSIVQKLLDNNPSAKVVSQTTDKVGAYSVDRMEAEFKVGTTPVFSQVALFQRDEHLYYQLQMTSPGRDPQLAADVVETKEKNARDVFGQMLQSVNLLEREAFKKEQRAAEKNSDAFLKTLDEKKLRQVLVPQHFMRVLEHGRDVGFIQVDERVSRNRGYDAIELIVRSRVENSAPAPAVENAVPSSETGGVVIPKVLQPDVAVSQVAKPTNVYMWSSYYMAYDRTHESWTSAAQVDDRVADQVTEDGDSNLVIKRGLDKTVRQVPGKQPKIIEWPDYTLDVTQQLPRNQQAVSQQPVGQQEIDPRAGKVPPSRSLGHSYHIPLAPVYIPQALGQLLPRVLPLDQPRQYLFTSYVGDVHDTLARYVEVGTPTTVTLDGKTVEAIPVSDRLGADGITTVHYMTAAGQWLGSVNEETATQVLPTDFDTLHARWGFLICPLPPNDENETGSRSARPESVPTGR